MSKEWETHPPTPLSNPRSQQPNLPTGPVTGPNSTKFLGRLVVEAWEPSDPSTDGIAYVVDIAGTSTPASADRFARDLIQRLHARFQRQQPL